ncbi:sulfotransferase 1B1-like [Physella acuta]|uniref:sulfotransferase 1B1-like n=1 Tax=Physella acuta TaxID=109671 RepID=UPI0027DB5F56|nr:sulfotransferase 1B1-like [Physella acuta]
MKLDSMEFPSNKSVYDADGVEMRLCEVDGKLLPCFNMSNITGVKDVQLRDDDVLLLGYPKTGCHWTWEVLSMMVAKNPILSELGKGTSFLEMSSAENIDRTPSPRVLNSHLWFDFLPTQLAEEKKRNRL